MFTFSFIFEGLLIYGAYRTLVSHTMSLDQLAVITSMMVSSTWILIGFTESLMTCYKNGLFVNNLRTFLEYEEKIPEDFEGIDPDPLIECIEFRNVSFSYKDKMIINKTGKYINNKTKAIYIIWTAFQAVFFTFSEVGVGTIYVSFIIIKSPLPHQF